MQINPLMAWHVIGYFNTFTFPLELEATILTDRAVNWDLFL